MAHAKISMAPKRRRVQYTARLGEVIYVLHAFKKKVHHGIATPPRELELIAARLQIAKAIARRE